MPVSAGEVSSKRVLPAGPRLDVNYVERVSPKRIRMVDVDRRSKRIGDRAIDVYEPRGQKELVRAGRENTKRNWAKLSSASFEERVKSRRQELVARAGGKDDVRLSRRAARRRESCNERSPCRATASRRSKRDRGSSCGHPDGRRRAHGRALLRSLRALPAGGGCRPAESPAPELERPGAPSRLARRRTSLTMRIRDGPRVRNRRDRQDLHLGPV